MGQSKGAGYKQMPTLNQGQQGQLNEITSGTNPLINQAAQGYQQFLPGGGGGQPIIDDAMRRFQQQTIPQIKNAFGSDSKGSSALNQALGASGADLQSSLMAQLAQLQLGASQGLGNLQQGQQQLGLGTPAFSYLQKQPPLWQQFLQSALGASGGIGQGIAALSSRGASGGVGALSGLANGASETVNPYKGLPLSNIGRFQNNFSDWNGAR